MRRAYVRRRLLVAAVVLAVIGLVVTLIVAFMSRKPTETLILPSYRCVASLGDSTAELNVEQSYYAAIIAGVAVQRGLPPRAVSIALATAFQESDIRNLDYGDRDSVGLFQQRPSQGWGTVEQILDPVFSTNAFYDALVQVEGYQEMPITEAAQAVQRSAFPDAYAQHEPTSRAWASAMYGYTPQSVTCTLDDPEGPGDAVAVAARVERDFGPLGTSVDAEGAVLVDASSMATGDDAVRLGWAVAHWAVAVASPLEVVRVEHETTAWDRDTGTWAPSEGAPLAAGQIRIVLAD